jgi:5'-3' exonuclease
MPQEATIVDFPNLFHRAFYAAPPLTYRDPKTGEERATGAILTAYRIIRRICKLYPVPPIFALEGGRKHNAEEPEESEPEIVVSGEDDVPDKVVSFKHKPVPSQKSDSVRPSIGPTQVREGTQEKKDRREISAEYKANRDNSRSGDFKFQWNSVLNMLKTGNGMLWSVPGYEADDLLASYAKDHDCYLFTNDQDLNGVLRPGVTIIKYGYKDLLEFSYDDFLEKYGFEPSYWKIYRSLTGDASDNIKGVPGWGPVQSAKAIVNYDGDPERMREEGYGKPYKVLRDNWHLFEESLALVQLRPDIICNEKPERLDWSTMETYLRANFGFTQF